MSEPIAGFPVASPTASRPRDAAVVVLVRGDGPLQTYWVKREAKLSFAGGFYAFPGGRVDPSDAGVAVRGQTGPEAMLRVAAVRELFEETGVLLAEGADRLDADTRAGMRSELLAKKGLFGELLARHSLQIAPEALVEAGRWITPAWLPARFDARFFLVQLPAEVDVAGLSSELSEGAWVRPEEALARWEQGTALLHPPNLFALQSLMAASSIAEAAERMSQPPYCTAFVPSRIEFQRGIRVFPLETPTLPPAAHTNSYVLGNGELLIVDPGAGAVRQYARLLALVASLVAEGKRPKAVVLTHHHSDHVSGADAVAQRLRIPIWAHPSTAERLSFKVSRMLNEGEVLTLAGSPSMRFQVLHTPGHARGHVCLVEEVSKAAIVGDMVSSLSTIVIDPPEGDMTDYLQQLARLRELPVRTIYPAHGPPIPDGPAKLTEYVRHREARELKVLQAIPPAGATLLDIVPRAYADVPPGVHPIAERTTQAILIKLVREGRVSRKDERYFPTS